MTLIYRICSWHSDCHKSRALVLSTSVCMSVNAIERRWRKEKVWALPLSHDVSMNRVWHLGREKVIETKIEVEVDVDRKEERERGVTELYDNPLYYKHQKTIIIQKIFFKPSQIFKKLTHDSGQTISFRVRQRRRKPNHHISVGKI